MWQSSLGLHMYQISDTPSMWSKNICWDERPYAKVSGYCPTLSWTPSKGTSVCQQKGKGITHINRIKIWILKFWKIRHRPLCFAHPHCHLSSHPYCFYQFFHGLHHCCWNWAESTVSLLRVSETWEWKSPSYVKCSFEIGNLTC